MKEKEEEEAQEASILDLPEEIIEYVLSLLSPYTDFQSARLVCKLWHKIMKGVVKQAYGTFLHSMSEGHIDWSCMEAEYGSMITERYSHSACYHNKCIYIFGGCTSTSTTFNDLWRFDLNKRQWIRPLAIGTYPSPKACATFVSYKDYLILFGGWSHPNPTPLHQPNNFFNELHIYCPKTNNWSMLMPQPIEGNDQIAPRGRAGHAASVVGDCMIVFGGSRAYGTRCDDVWVLDLLTMTWTHVDIPGIRPRPRFGHSQIALDDENLLIIGGCAGPNMQFNDVWLLKMTPADWVWRELKITGHEFSPPKLWCHPVCKVGDKVIILSKLSSRSPRLASDNSSPAENVIRVVRPASHVENGRKSLPKRRLPETSESSSQESSSDGEERNMTHRKQFGPACSTSKMSARLSTALKVDTASGGGRGGGQEPPNRPSVENQPGRSSSMETEEGANSHNAESSSRSHSKGEGGGSLPAFPQNYPSNTDPSSPSSPHTLPVRDGMPSIRPNAMKNRQKQLEALRRHEERIRSKINQPFPGGNFPPGNRPGGAAGAAAAASLMGALGQQQKATNTDVVQLIRNPMYVHALDISKAVSDEEVRWHDVSKDFTGLPPEEKMFYSLTQARGELVMFGGIKSDFNTMHHAITTRCASNTTHILKAKPKLR